MAVLNERLAVVIHNILLVKTGNLDVRMFFQSRCSKVCGRVFG